MCTSLSIPLSSTSTYGARFSASKEKFQSFSEKVTFGSKSCAIRLLVEINSLDFGSLSLNLAMPREYLDPPVQENEDIDGEGVIGDGCQRKGLLLMKIKF